MIINPLGILLPLIYVSGSIFIIPIDSNPSTTFSPALSSLASLKKSILSKIGCIQGFNFSFSLPGRYPKSFPIGIIGLAIKIFLYLFFSTTSSSPAAMAKSVLPVPAPPTNVTTFTLSSISSSIANLCSSFLALSPQACPSPRINFLIFPSIYLPHKVLSLYFNLKKQFGVGKISSLFKSVKSILPSLSNLS